MHLSNKGSIRDLVEICYQKGIKHIVICPGSRNAPLTISFNQHGGFQTYSIVDERCAAFFALGMAQQLKEPVAITCTSGTASLNFAPAIAEAYYQKIPLLVLTADRPTEWVDQMDGQTIRQSNIYSNYIKKSFDLLMDSDVEDERWMNGRSISEAIEATLYPEAGPVHINIPLREPLYGVKDYSDEPSPKIFETVKTQLQFPQEEIEKLKNAWKGYKKILIITGLLHPNKAINNTLDKISKLPQVAVLTETTSNLFGDNFNRSIDRLIVSIEEENSENYQPELLITIGGPVVSKKIKAFVRTNQPQEHWHVNASNDCVDTFKSLTKIIPVAPENILPHFEELKSDSNYQSMWIEKDKKLFEVFQEFLNSIKFCDLKAFEQILGTIPQNSNLQLANSTAVRYSNLFDKCGLRSIYCYSNRGTSGIDGTISTAVGAANASDDLTTVISGDLSFLYDSNALWIKPMPSNLRIIIINNGGGNIFRIIEGPKSTAELETFFEAQHNINAEGIASSFGIKYYGSKTEESLVENLKEIYSSNFSQACILEVFTDNEINPEILKLYFKHLKEN